MTTWRRYCFWACLIAAAVPAKAAGQDRPATGFALSARVGQGSLQQLLESGTGSPQFTLGHRGENVSIGLGFGLTTIRATDRNEFGGGVSESKTTARLFQIGPDVSVRVWESMNRMTVGYLALGATVGHVSATDESSYTGFPSNESKVGGTLFGLRVGLAGEHFVDRDFAIGVEGGFRNTFATGVEQEGSMDTIGLGVGGAYAALRLTVVLGS